MKLNSQLLSFFLILLFPFYSWGQEKNNSLKLENLGISKDSLNKMNKYFHSLVDKDSLAGIQTAVMKNGELIHFDSYGYADIENREKIDEKSIFRIFSMTKPIVSVALMQLYEEGKFNLSDPVHKFIPEFRMMNKYEDDSLVKVHEPIKIIHLLTHTSGFSHGRVSNQFLKKNYQEAQLFQAKNNKELANKLSRIPLQFEPGTDWQYGLSTALCGYLVEVLSGTTLDKYLEEHIFKPLEMKDTFFELPKGKMKHLTVGYKWSKERGVFISDVPEDSRYSKKVTLFHGGGGLLSTTLDYLKFCKMMRDKGVYNGRKVLEKSTVALIFTNHIEQATKIQSKLRLPPGEGGFGLGFAIRKNNTGELENVYGWGGLAGTFFKINMDLDLIYVLMVQLYPHGHLNLRKKFQNYVESSVIKN